MPSAPIARGLWCLVGAAVGLGTPACGGNAGLGESCSSVSDCEDSLQCFDHICVPRCTRNADCGDGHSCDRGICTLSELGVEGATCFGEYDCAPGLSCQLASMDINHDGFLTSSCQPENSGAVLDDPCDADLDCRTGTCVLGRCVDVCNPETLVDVDSYSDCPADHTCTTIPRELAGPGDNVATFYGCLPSLGNIGYQLPIEQAYSHFLLSVPGNAVSVALVAEVDDPNRLVGAAVIFAPDGTKQFDINPYNRDHLFSNAIRSDLVPGTWTLVLPQKPADAGPDLVPGAYTVELGSFFAPTQPATNVPRVRAVYKLDATALNLELRFHFLDLSNHPCPGADLDAASAQTSVAFQNSFVHTLTNTFGTGADIAIIAGAITYDDITDRHDLDGLDASHLGDLLSLSTVDGGVDVFFVRTISPSGVQALSGGPPSPPGIAGTRGSGVAIGLDTLCYRDWVTIAHDAAHVIARSLGLMRSVEPDGYTDPLADTDFGADNLMYFSENGDDNLTTDQKKILQKSPALRRP